MKRSYYFNSENSRQNSKKYKKMESTEQIREFGIDSLEQKLKLVDLDKYSKFIRRFFEPEENDDGKSRILYEECKKRSIDQTETTPGDVLDFNKGLNLSLLNHNLKI